MKPAPQKHWTTNWRAYNATLKARGSLLIWLDPAMNWHGQATGKRGRSPRFSDEAIQFCLSIKCLINLPLRQAMGDGAELAADDRPRLAGSRLCIVSRRQKTYRLLLKPYRPQRTSTCWSIVPASKCLAKANGRPGSMVQDTGAYGARFISALMPPRWRSGPCK